MNVRGATGATGPAGERGTGILKVTTTPTSYTTATAGVNPIKRMSLATIKSEAGVSEVLVGDTVAHSYYLYHIYYLDSSYAYMDKSQSIRGAKGDTGPAYTLTDADKSSIASSVKASLPALTLTGTDENDVVHTYTIYGEKV